MTASAAPKRWSTTASLHVVASLDPRPDTVEDVLNVCPQQASSFVLAARKHGLDDPTQTPAASLHVTFQPGGRHLRLAWFHSPPVEACNWPGRDGVARVRVDAALRPKDPAVLLIPGVPSVTARDPIVQLEACAIPPHFVQPWATIDVMGDAVRGEEGIGGSADGQAVDAGNDFTRDAGGEQATSAASESLRPESVLELLRGSVVRAGGIIRFLASPNDPACRGVRLRCRRGPDPFIPDVVVRGHSYRSRGKNTHRELDERGERSGNGGISIPVAGDRVGDEQQQRSRGGRERGNTSYTSHDLDREGIDTLRRGNRDRRDHSMEGADRGVRRDRGRSRREATATLVAGLTRGGTVRGGGGGENHPGKNAGRLLRAGDWAPLLREWGVVTTCTKVVIADSALEVRCHDAEEGGEVSSDGAQREDAGAAKMDSSQDEVPAAAASSWVEAVLQSHDPAFIRDLSASLELVPPSPRFSHAGCDGDHDDRPAAGSDAGDERGGGREIKTGGGGSRCGSRDERGDGLTGSENGAVLVHGPPGVGKTLLVEALAARLRCRLVKLSPGRLAAAAGVEADRVLTAAFEYCRQCVSDRVLLLLDSIDRLVPAADGGVGVSRGEVDAGVLNALVLAVEQGRGDPRWGGRVAVVFVTSWPEKVHPTARRCAGQELIVLPPSQPLRASILRRALLMGGGSSGSHGRRTGSDRLGSELVEEAVLEVAGPCQGFTAPDMYAIAAGAFDLLGPSLSLRGEAIRTAFRQVQQRVAAGRGGTGGGGGEGGGASVTGVPSVRWSEVGGLERAKRAVQEMVVWPARYPEAFSHMGITPASGVLLFGPPGTGKTLLAKAAATETGATFIELKISDVVRGEIGESEKAIDRAFRTARELAPSIVFIDEFQALFACRDVEGTTGSRLASQLLVCMDELARWRSVGYRQNEEGVLQESEKAFPGERCRTEEGGGRRRGVNATNVMVLAATNAPEAVDAAFLRPGRFDEIVYAGLPDAKGRRHILQAAKNRMEGQQSTHDSAPGVIAPQATVEIPPLHPALPLPAARMPPSRALPVPPNLEDTIDDTTAVGKIAGEGGESTSHRGGGGGSGGGGRWASDVDVEWLSRETEGYSGADLSSLVRNAAMAALREREKEEMGQGVGGGMQVGTRSTAGVWGRVAELDFLELARRHFQSALESTSPSSGVEAIAKHDRWARQWHVA